MKFNVFRQCFAFYFVSGPHVSREEKELQPHRFLQSSVSFASCWLAEGYSFLPLSLSILRGRQAMVASGGLVVLLAWGCLYLCIACFCLTF